MFWTKRESRLPLALVTALLVLLVASLTGVTLWALRRVHGQLAHATATRTVVEQGRRIAELLARQPAAAVGETEEGAWSELSRIVGSLHCVEDGLQYVSVTRDGLTVFHEQSQALDAGVAHAPELGDPVPGPVRISRRLLHVQDREVPVVVFSKSFVGDDGVPRVVEVALRRDAVGREEQHAFSAIRSMFRVSLATVLVSFCCSAALVVWMIWRESARERLRRREEHLAFAGMLANGIVHDFRNPMSAMRLDVQMLARETAKGDECRLDRVSSLADRVRGTLDRLDKVFQEFLYTSRPPTGDLQAVDVVRCARESVDMLRARLDRAGVGVCIEAAEDPLYANADELGIRRALMNVVMNAEQASREGQEIAIRVARQGKRVHVDVRDQGPGVSRSERKRIFDMFVTGRPEGTGLGLFLARAAVERCGGTLTLLDSHGPGACFRVDLELHEAEGRGHG
jgi:signal transduction histidine kinase